LLKVALNTIKQQIKALPQILKGISDEKGEIRPSIYRIMADTKVETDIIASIAASPIGQTVMM